MKVVNGRKAVNGKWQKTLTLFGGSDPIATIALGRLTAKEFSKAFAKEGWDPSDHKKDDIRYEFWRQSKRGWKPSTINDLKAKLVTVSDW